MSVLDHDQIYNKGDLPDSCTRLPVCVHLCVALCLMSVGSNQWKYQPLKTGGNTTTISPGIILQRWGSYEGVVEIVSGFYSLYFNRRGRQKLLSEFQGWYFCCRRSLVMQMLRDQLVLKHWRGPPDLGWKSTVKKKYLISNPLKFLKCTIIASGSVAHVVMAERGRSMDRKGGGALINRGKRTGDKTPLEVHQLANLNIYKCHLRVNHS